MGSVGARSALFDISSESERNTIYETYLHILRADRAVCVSVKLLTGLFPSLAEEKTIFRSVVSIIL